MHIPAIDFNLLNLIFITVKVEIEIYARGVMKYTFLILLSILYTEIYFE
jgi:hypothetical protein